MVMRDRGEDAGPIADPTGTKRPGIGTSDGLQTIANDVLRLQRLAGNQAVTSLLRERGGDRQCPPTLQDRGQVMAVLPAAFAPADSAPPAPPAPSVQRVRGIPLDTEVVVTNPTAPTWYGVVKRAVGDFYEVKPHGDGSAVTVPQAQVTVKPAAPPEGATPDAYFASLPLLDVKGEAATFAGASMTARRLVDAAYGLSGENRETALHTIAMFSYLSRQADAIGARIDKDLSELAEPHQKDSYLKDAAARMSPKLLDRGLWTGEEERGEIIFGGSLVTFFKGGAQLLLQKAQEADARGRSLVGLLDVYAWNLEAKSYGRRKESLNDKMTTKYIEATTETAPPVNAPVSYDSLLEVSDLYALLVEPKDLHANEDYYVKVSATQEKPYIVTVASNDTVARTVTFSSVEAT